MEQLNSLLVIETSFSTNYEQYPLDSAVDTVLIKGIPYLNSNSKMPLFTFLTNCMEKNITVYILSTTYRTFKRSVIQKILCFGGIFIDDVSKINL
ncbi:MAG: hypothetical protein RR594_02030 [Clostridia bacterium]